MPREAGVPGARQSPGHQIVGIPAAPHPARTRWRCKVKSFASHRLLERPRYQYRISCLPSARGLKQCGTLPGEPAGQRDRGARVAFTDAVSGASLSLLAGAPTANVHVAFPGTDDAVRRFYADALASGYTGNGEPGARIQYHDGYYAAFVLDPDGNNIEFVNHHRS